MTFTKRFSTKIDNNVYSTFTLSTPFIHLYISDSPNESAFQLGNDKSYITSENRFENQDHTLHTLKVNTSRNLSPFRSSPTGSHSNFQHNYGSKSLSSPYSSPSSKQGYQNDKEALHFYLKITPKITRYITRAYPNYEQLFEKYLEKALKGEVPLEHFTVNIGSRMASVSSYEDLEKIVYQIHGGQLDSFSVERKSRLQNRLSSSGSPSSVISNISPSRGYSDRYGSPQKFGTNLSFGNVLVLKIIHEPLEDLEIKKEFYIYVPQVEQFSIDMIGGVVGELQETIESLSKQLRDLQSTVLYQKSKINGLEFKNKSNTTQNEELKQELIQLKTNLQKSIQVNLVSEQKIQRLEEMLEQQSLEWKKVSKTFASLIPSKHESPFKQMNESFSKYRSNDNVSNTSSQFPNRFENETPIRLNPSTSNRIYSSLSNSTPQISRNISTPQRESPSPMPSENDHLSHIPPPYRTSNQKSDISSDIDNLRTYQLSDKPVIYDIGSQSANYHQNNSNQYDISESSNLRSTPRLNDEDLRARNNYINQNYQSNIPARIENNYINERNRTSENTHSNFTPDFYSNPIYRQDNRNGNLQKPNTKSDNLSFSKIDICSHFSLENENTTVIYSKASPIGKWGTCFANENISWTSGIHQWEMKIDYISDKETRNIMIGVVDISQYSFNVEDQYCGESQNSWSIHFMHLDCYHDNTPSTPFGDQFVAISDGSIIKLTLDLDRRTLSLSIDGENLGIAWSNLPAGEYVPCVSLFHQFQQISFLSYIQLK